MADWLIPASAVAIPNIGGFLGSISVKKNMKWYESLERPSWKPPSNAVFAPVWTSLYSGIGYASYMVWKSGGGFQGQALVPLSVYAGHLALNFAWSPIFFKYHKLQLAFYEIVALDIAAVATGVLFYQIKPAAGYIFLPYIAWLTYATALTYSIYKKNTKKIQ